MSEGKSIPGTLKKALLILEFVASSESACTLSEISSALDIPKPTVYRLINGLVLNGYILQDTNKRFQLGYKLLVLGGVVRQKSVIRQVALPFLKELQQLTNETVHLTVPDGKYGVYLEKLESSNAIRLWTMVGAKLPLTVGASMRAILAFLPNKRKEEIIAEHNFKLTSLTLSRSQLKKIVHETRKNRYTVSFGEADSGAVALAVPILDNHDIAVAAVSVAGPAVRFTQEKLAKWMPEVKKCADKIMKALFV
ncbi:MAG: IclR family transcriptional regulator [Epsilonproteobacteria bacterium]|nr:IclR family transcriptional regulator [Campylobacterota bacterium]